MKRKKGLYKQICDFPNFEIAYQKARRCKRYRNEVLRFSANKEENLIRLQDQFVRHTYKQGKYRTFTVIEPKKRLISALPFADRVAQHAICNIIEPIIDKRFYYHSYACRKGRGMHAASETLSAWIHNNSYEGKPLYSIKADIHHYFQSVDHKILKKALRRIIKDEELLGLLDLIIDSNGASVGIPVGNLTSQLFANLYLDALDKYIKEVLGVKLYIRYMDDFIILSDDKEYLRNMLTKIEGFLSECLALTFNPKTNIICANNGVDFCGYRHWKDHKKIRKSSVKRVQRTIKIYLKEKITQQRLEKSMQSWLGHARHADTYHLRQRMMQKAQKGVVNIKQE